MRLVLLSLTPELMRQRLSDAMDVYLAAMEYDFSWKHNRRRAWYQATFFEGWTAFGLFDYTDDDSHPDNTPARAPLVGITYGYRGHGDSWWSEQIRNGMQSEGLSPQETEQVLKRYFELSEIHIAPAYQGHGWGQKMLQSMENSCHESRIILSTPECAGENNAAWHLYRRANYQDLLRNFYFPGDDRAFGVLIKELRQST